MRMFLAILIITFLSSCGLNGENDKTKNYTVTTDGGESCSVMIRPQDYSSYAEFTLQCPRGTKINCMRIYDNSTFILGTKSSYVSTSNYGLVAADGYGNGTIYVKDKFNFIASVSLSGTSCN